MATFPQPDPQRDPGINPFEWGEMFSAETPKTEGRVKPRDPYGDFGYLRIEVADDWSVESFRDLLGSVQEIHDSLTALEYLGILIALERESNFQITSQGRLDAPNHHWETLFVGNDSAALEPLASIKEILRPIAIQLNISALRMESPGWAELVGHLNPLKTIADFITKWRAENTKRRKMEFDSQLARQKADREFAMKVYGMLPDTHARSHLGRRMAETSEEIIK